MALAPKHQPMQRFKGNAFKSLSPPRSVALPYSSSTASPSVAPVTVTYQSQSLVSPSSASVVASSLLLIPSTLLLPHQYSHYPSISQAELLTSSLDPIDLPEVRISRATIARVVQVCRGKRIRVRAGLRLQVGFLRARWLEWIVGLIRRRAQSALTCGQFLSFISPDKRSVMTYSCCLEDFGEAWKVVHACVKCADGRVEEGHCFAER